jgi:hypothetical protein
MARVFFKKAEPKKAFVKMSMYGVAGTGKTFTSLLLMEGLAKLYRKRFAFIDSERGTDFYTQHVATRPVHPEPFDFDADYTRSIVELNQACRSLDPNVHCGLVVDSVSHFWEATMNAYNGPRIDGKIPMHAWGAIKAPWKEFMAWVVNSPFHVIICGREANIFSDDDSVGDAKGGKKMRAEGEAAHEPDFCLRLVPERIKPTKKGEKVIVRPAALVEKDRSGVLQGKYISLPDFDSVIKPILPLLGHTHAQIPDEAEEQRKDVEGIAQQQREKVQKSAELLKEFKARMDLAVDRPGLDALQPEISKAKKSMTADDVAQLREHWLTASGKFPSAKSKKEPAAEAADPQSNGSPEVPVAPGE